MTTKYAELCHYFQVQTLILTHSWELRASSFVAIRPFTVYYARAMRRTARIARKDFPYLQTSN